MRFSKVSKGGAVGPIIFFTDIREIASLTSREWEAYMNLLTDREQNKVLKYRFDDDRRRALVSLLLQKAAVRAQLGVDSNMGFKIHRTPEVSVYDD